MRKDLLGKLAEELNEKAENALKEAMAELSTDQFAASVVSRLREHQNNTIWRLLGLDDRWGRWEVDHCNGRNSPITQYLSAAAEPAVREWVNQAVFEVIEKDGEKMRARIYAKLRDEIEERYYRLLHRAADAAIDEAASAHGKQIAAELLAGVMGEGRMSDGLS